jgi:hypothetical protein
MQSLKRERSCVQLPLLPIDERRPFTWHEKISWNSASTDDADSLSGESLSEDQTSSEFDDALIDSLVSQAASISLFDSPVSKKPVGLVLADGTSRESRHGSPTSRSGDDRWARQFVPAVMIFLRRALNLVLRIAP